jgi:glycosyltransferase involved in cell wall biosynthesis
MASILFVNKASIDYLGGAETRIRELATRWAAAGHKVYAICAKTSVDQPLSAVENGVTVRRVRVMPDRLLRRFCPPHYLPQALFYIVGPPLILYYYRRWRIDVIRDSMSPFPGLSLLAPILGCRAIVVLHILFGDYYQWRHFYSVPYAFMGMIAERLLLKGWLSYKAIVTDSPWLASYIRERAERCGKVQAIENGVNFAAIAKRAPRGAIRRLVNAARLVEHKGQTELVEAGRKLRDQGVPFELDIYGNGELEPVLRKIIRANGLESYIRLFPALSHDALLRRLCEYDLYVMSSRSEGLPVILLEAMAAQLPVVVAARPYATTLFDPTTIQTYEPGDPHDLAKIIAQAIKNPEETEKQAGRAHEWVQKLSWDRTAEEELRLLEALQQ